MKLSHRLLLPLAALSFSLPATADTVSGTIVYHNDVVQIPISVTETTDLTIWTDSFASGGFDPILTLWLGGNLVTYNDDSQSVDPAQSYLDSVLRLKDLAPGSYLLTVTSYNNFANGTTFAGGFLHDGAEPILIESWTVQRTGNYNVHWVPEFLPFLSAVPEPSSAAMLLAGLGIAGAFARSRAVRK